MAPPNQIKRRADMPVSGQEYGFIDNRTSEQADDERASHHLPTARRCRQTRLYAKWRAHRDPVYPNVGPRRLMDLAGGAVMKVIDFSLEGPIPQPWQFPGQSHSTIATLEKQGAACLRASMQVPVIGLGAPRLHPPRSLLCTQYQQLCAGSSTPMPPHATRSELFRADCIKPHRRLCCRWRCLHFQRKHLFAVIPTKLVRAPSLELPPGRLDARDQREALLISVKLQLACGKPVPGPGLCSLRCRKQ
ncbi:hypothetical protein N658DRAFT_484023 [Parathielavia hyrcaniae]|uniref:Uncharacterized protein n=1 Tax=Parathielavia hyrcaniae TaxID=113614 RepID=A0AAN6QB21_9PEZI|nr:hypothetical protein N658DRAFT_484023 [Parathielavia hyrcaniae]